MYTIERRGGVAINMAEETQDHIIDLAIIPTLENPLQGTVAIYARIYDVLYELIRSGKVKPGDVIPGENTLATHFGVSRGTIRNALRYLEEDGSVIKRQGRSSEVADLEHHRSSGLDTYSDVCMRFATVSVDDVKITWSFTGAGQWIGEQLELQKGALVIVAEITYYHDGEIIAVSQRLMSAALLEQYAVGPNSYEEMYEFLLKKMPQIITRSKSEILVWTSGVEEIPKSDEIATLAISEITYDGQDKPVSHSKNYLRSDSYKLYVNRRQPIR